MVRCVAVACNERPVRVASRPLNRVPSVRFSPLCAAKHDEGVYRLHSLKGVLLTTLALTDTALAYELETTQAVSCVALPLKPY